MPRLGEQGLQVDPQGFVVAIDGGPDHGFAAHSWAADTGDGGRDDLVAEGEEGGDGESAASRVSHS